MERKHFLAAGAAFVMVGVSGCVLAPRGTADERQRMADAGKVWRTPAEHRELPELPDEPTWRELLRRALLANGDLEASYLAWRAAVERIDVAAGYPNTNVSLGYQYLFSGEGLKGFDRSTFTIGFDPMQNLSFPTKVMAAGREALAEAQAAGQRFVAAKLELQREVLGAWHEYALTAERLRIEREKLVLLEIGAASAEARLEAGGAQRELLDAEVQRTLSEDAVQRLEATLLQQRAGLNALLARRAEAPLAPPEELPPPRPLPSEDARLLAASAVDNPELRALGHEVEARAHSVDRARQEFIPDLNPFAGFTGAIEQVAGVMASLPARIPIILGMIRAARSDLARAEALERQASLDQDAAFTAKLAALRDLERQALLIREEILPAAERAAASARTSYQVGALELPALLAAEELVLEIRLLAAEARTGREVRLAELEVLAGRDVETLARTNEVSTVTSGRQS